MRIASSIVLAALGLGFAGAASAQDAQIAVAANFTAAAEELAAAFGAETGHEIGFSFGATGQLYAQITQGAPFDALLAADDERPAMLVEEGLAEADTLFTYAIGQLALFSIEPDRVTGPESLEGDFTQLAIAEPAAAPYGAAAVETIAALGLTEAVADRLVTGQNISQTYQFIDTGNAELGFVALSQIIEREDGSRWIVDADLYTPIAQDAVLVNADNDVARAFLEFMQGEEGRAIIATYGYGFADE